MKGILGFLVLVAFLKIVISLTAEEGSILVPMKSVNITVPYNTGRKYFTIPIQLGTPKKTFNVQIDTSVATSWVPSTRCRNCGKSTALYNHLDSKTASPTNQKVELDDENGDVEGFKVQDSIEVSGFKLKEYGFIEVEELDEDFSDHYDGKLGLGFRGPHGREYNFLSKMKFDGLISKQIVSIEELNSTYGHLLIGDLPVQNYKYCNLTFTEDLDDEYRESWVCELSHIGFFDNSTDATLQLSQTEEITNGRVDFDSAYDYIAVPIRDLPIFKNNLFDPMGCSSYQTSKTSEDEVVYLCDKAAINENLTITFVLQGSGYSIPINDLFIETTTPGKMEFLIRFMNEDDKDIIWTFGYPFMRKFMIIFNMEKRHVGIHSNPKKNTIINMEKDWIVYHQKVVEKREHERNMFWVIVGCVILVGVLIVVIAYLIIRTIRKRSLEQNGPMIEQENYNPDRIY